MRTFSFFHIARYLLFTLVSFCLFTLCKPKKQEIPPFGDVFLQVVDENKKPVDSATIYLYDSEAAFDLAYQKSLNSIYDGVGSIQTGTIVNGKFNFTELPSNKEYWVLAHDVSGEFMDGPNKTGIAIERDNADAFYYVPSFQNGTKVTAIINLVPAFSLIKFDAGNSSDNTFTKIKIGNLDTNSVPSSYIKVRKGDLPYYIRTNHCVWTGAVNAVGGKVITESLSVCASSLVTFNYASTLSTGERLDVYIGQNRSKPVVTMSNATSGSVILAAGDNYTYYAEKIDNVTGQRKCVWEGYIGTLTNGSSVTITLAKCD